MALTYADQGTLVANVNWQKRIAAAVSDVAQNVITKLPNTTPNYTRMNEIAKNAVRDQASTPVFAALTAAGFGAAVSALATPVEATGTDQQLRQQVQAAIEAFAVT